MHVHRDEHEAWYILDGQMTFTVDVEPTRVLVLATPAGFEGFAAELGVPALSEVPPVDLVLPTPDVLGPVAARYGIEVVGPPLRVMR